MVLGSSAATVWGLLYPANGRFIFHLVHGKAQNKADGSSPVDQGPLIPCRFVSGVTLIDWISVSIEAAAVNRATRC